MEFVGDKIFDVWNILFLLINVIFAGILFSVALKKWEKTREILAYSLIFVFLNDSFMGFILAFFAAFNIKNLFLILLIESIVLLAYVKIRKKKIVKPRLFKNINIIFAVVVLAAMFLYFAYPVHYLIARRDPSLYTINGINISNTGSFEFATNDFIDENYEDVKEFTDYLYRGFDSDYIKGTSPNPSHYTSQFLHLFSVSLAIGYSVAGYEGLLAIPAIIGVLGLLAAYYAASNIFSKRVATIFSMFLLCCPAQIWGARITQTEIMCQMIYMLSMLCFYKGYKEEKYGVFVFGSLLLGIIGFIRIDAYLSGIGFILAILLLVVFSNYDKLTLIGSSLVYIAVSVVTLGYSMKYSPYYFKSHWDAGFIDKAIITLAVVFVLEVLAVIIKIIFRVNLSRFNFLNKICSNSKVRSSLMFFFVLLFFVCYSVRPLFQKNLDTTIDSDFNNRALVEFCMYISLIAVPFFFAGIWKIISNLKETYANLILLGTGFINLVLYIYKPGIAPDHIWAGRRWLSVCFVFVLLIAAYGIESFASWLSRSSLIRFVVCFSASVLISGIMLYSCRVILFKSFFKGIEDDYNKLVEQMDDDGIYYCETPLIANYLRNVYGKNAFVLSCDTNKDLAEYLKTTDYELYYIGSEQNLVSSSIELTEVYSGKIEGNYIEQKMGSLPKNVVKSSFVTNIYKMEYEEHGILSFSELPREKCINEFIKRCYKVFLGRSSDETGLKNFYGLVDNNGYTSKMMVQSFMTSPEFTMNNPDDETIINSIYIFLYDRNPSQEELENMKEAMKDSNDISEAILNAINVITEEEWHRFDVEYKFIAET